MIAIYIPIIKDKNVYIAFKNDYNILKIIQRSYKNIPFTVNFN